MQDYKIVVAGLGGVGGFLGAALASTYPDVSFYARGARKDSIQKNGLILKSDYLGDCHVTPTLVTDDTNEIGIADILFICVKNYSLEQICKELLPIVDEHTIIVPVLNGVDAASRTHKILDKGIIVESVIYIMSNSQPDYTIVQKDRYATLRIGTKSTDLKVKNAVQTIHDVITAAKINCFIEEDIIAAIWKKYISNYGFNVVTAAYNINTKELRENPQYGKDLRALMEEAHSIATQKHINIPKSFIKERVDFFLKKQDPAGTSSLKLDVEAGRPCELETFSGYLLTEATKYDIELPKTLQYYEILIKKIRENTAQSELDSLLQALETAREISGAKSEEVATCYYNLGVYYVNCGQKMKAMEAFGDSLYIRRGFFDEDSIYIKEIYYGLEQCTFM